VVVVADGEQPCKEFGLLVVGPVLGTTDSTVGVEIGFVVDVPPALEGILIRGSDEGIIDGLALEGGGGVDVGEGGMRRRGVELLLLLLLVVDRRG
jgi:hypothetical protein